MRDPVYWSGDITPMNEESVRWFDDMVSRRRWHAICSDPFWFETVLFIYSLP